MSTAHPLHRPDRYPRSSRYDQQWVMGLDMGPHPLWQLEDLLGDLPLEPGSRVLDLGCGKGATSVFLAREFGAQVTAVDLWVEAGQIAETCVTAGVGDQVRAVQADARDLPFGDGEFDAIVSIDAFEYFGTDVRFLPSVLRVLRAGGSIGMTTPALRVDPYLVTPPPAVLDLVGWECAAWHSPPWWVRHWQLTGMLRDIQARLLPGGKDDWRRWALACGEAPDGPLLAMLDSDEDDLIGFAAVTGVKTGG